MAFSEDVFPPDDRCEICGAGLEDEIVIQEFADGSMARLCSECATGAALGADRRAPAPPPSSAGQADVGAEDSDPLDMTKELLSPVVDLITLQGEMQAALERLAASLERFAAGVLTESLDKTAFVENRLQTLEGELEQTRLRLLETEFLLNSATGAITAPNAPGGPAVEEAPSALAQTEDEAEPEPYAAEVPATAWPVAPVAIEDTFPAADAFPAAAQPAAQAAASIVEPEIAWPELVSEDGSVPAPPAMVAPEAPVAPVPIVAPPAAAPAHAAASEPRTFRLEEVQLAQRFFNESPFVNKTRDVRRSLGRPRANLSPAMGAEPRAFITIFWDIVWYQYLVDLRRDIPADERVVLHREGMDLDELTAHFKEKNSSIDDDGRLDSSELEVRLLSDPSALITEMTPDDERALEDATEEVWDQHISPEFKWDD